MGFASYNQVMVSRVFREVTESDLEGFADLISVVYNDGQPILRERYAQDFRKNYCLVEAGTVLGGFSVLAFDATRGRATMPCAGIQGVAVYPEVRGCGVGSDLMREAVRELRSQGYVLSSLYGFRETWYRRIGYEVAGKRLRITCPADRLPAVKSRLHVKRMGPADWLAFDVCHRKFGSERSGVHLRNESLWKRFLAESTPNTVFGFYNDSGVMEGYIALALKTAFWTEQTISEVCWTTEEAYRAALNVMRDIAVNKTAISWYESSESPFYARYIDQGIEVHVVRPIMFRVLDVPKALACLKPEGTGEVHILIEDDLVPENRGPWRVSFSPSNVKVEACKAAEVGMTIGIFTQAFLGEPSVAELARHGFLNGSTNHLQALQQLLPELPVYCGDFF